MKRRDDRDSTAGVPPELLAFDLGRWSSWPPELVDEAELERAVLAWLDGQREWLAAGGPFALDLVDVYRRARAVRRRLSAGLRRDLPPRRG